MNCDHEPDPDDAAEQTRAMHLRNVPHGGVPALPPARAGFTDEEITPFDPPAVRTEYSLADLKDAFGVRGTA